MHYTEGIRNFIEISLFGVLFSLHRYLTASNSNNKCMTYARNNQDKRCLCKHTHTHKWMLSLSVEHFGTEKR